MSARRAVDVVRDGDWLVAAWHGEIDMTNAEALEEHTLGYVRNTDAGLTVDLTGVSYLDSAGIRSLVAIRLLLADRQQRPNIRRRYRGPIRLIKAVRGRWGSLQNISSRELLYFLVL